VNAVMQFPRHEWGPSFYSVRVAIAPLDSLCARAMRFATAWSKGSARGR
jgi:hypothetical protein